jgi:hypothetical protein
MLCAEYRSLNPCSRSDICQDRPITFCGTKDQHDYTATGCTWLLKIKGVLDLPQHICQSSASLQTIFWHTPGLPDRLPAVPQYGLQIGYYLAALQMPSPRYSEALDFQCLHLRPPSAFSGSTKGLIVRFLDAQGLASIHLLLVAG